MVGAALGALTALAPLILALMERRAKAAPQRERAQRDEDYERDIRANAQAAAAGDAATLTRNFEAERQAAIRRGVLNPRGDAGELQQLP